MKLDCFFVINNKLFAGNFLFVSDFFCSLRKKILPNRYFFCLFQKKIVSLQAKKTINYAK